MKTAAGTTVVRAPVGDRLPSSTRPPPRRRARRPTHPGRGDPQLMAAGTADRDRARPTVWASPPPACADTWRPCWTRVPWSPGSRSAAAPAGAGVQPGSTCSPRRAGPGCRTPTTSWRSQALEYLAETGGAAAVTGFARRRAEAVVAPFRDRLDAAPTSRPRPMCWPTALTAAGFSASVEQVGVGDQLCQHHCPVGHVGDPLPAAVRGGDRGVHRGPRHLRQRLATIAHGDSACTTFVPAAAVAASAAAVGQRRPQSGHSAPHCPAAMQRRKDHLMTTAPETGDRGSEPDSGSSRPRRSTRSGDTRSAGRTPMPPVSRHAAG